MSILFWIPFFFAAPPHDACSTRGAPLLEIRAVSEIDGPTSTTRIFDSGAWTFAHDGEVERGCFERKELRAIRRAVQRAPWQVATSPIACFARDRNFTEYRVHGDLRFTERVCSGKTVDVTTRQAIDLVTNELADERAEQAPPEKPQPVPMPPVPMPPVAACRAEGTPLFAIRHRADATAASSTTTIYPTGAWTVAVDDADGRAGPLSTGCLDARTTDALREVIDQSPWQTSLSKIVCEAYSPSFTEYLVHGRLTYTARICGAQHLDAKSLGAIKVIEGELARAHVLTPPLPRADG